jgi:hypothetical protein
MLPLDHAAAVEHLLPAWRVTITDFRRGVRYIVTVPGVLDRHLAVAEALRDAEERHPELTAIGETHGVTKRERVHDRKPGDEVEGVPA